MIANLLSICRILLAPAVVWSLHREAASATTLMLLLTGGLTDLLDGVAARRLRQISGTGRILDPIADKVFIGSVCAGLAAWHAFPVWLLTMQLMRDVAIVAVASYLLRSRKMVIGASRLGKASTVTMGCTIVAFLLPTVPQLQQGLTLATGVLLVLSASGYAIRMWNIFIDDGANRGKSIAV